MDNAGMNARSSTSEKHSKASESRVEQPTINRPELTKSLKNENKSRFCPPLSLTPIILSRCIGLVNSSYIFQSLNVNYCKYELLPVEGWFIIKNG